MAKVFFFLVLFCVAFLKKGKGQKRFLCTGKECRGVSPAVPTAVVSVLNELSYVVLNKRNEWYCTRRPISSHLDWWRAPSWQD